MVATSRSFGEMRGGRLGKRGPSCALRAADVCVGGAVADEWIPILPGTEGQVALAIGRIMVDEGIGAAATSPFAGVFAGADVTAASSLSGIPEERLVALARTFGSFDRPTAIPGGSVAAQSNGPQAVTAIMALNAAGRTSGRCRQCVHPDPAGRNRSCPAQSQRPTRTSRR